MFSTSILLDPHRKHPTIIDTHTRTRAYTHVHVQCKRAHGISTEFKMAQAVSPHADMSIYMRALVAIAHRFLTVAQHSANILEELQSSADGQRLYDCI